MTNDPEILGLYSSEPEYNMTSGGVGAARHFLFQALKRRYTKVQLYQPPLPHPELAAEVTGTAHRTLKRRPDVFRAKSRAVEQFISQQAPLPDLVFQWEFFFAPFSDDKPRVPYVLYNDWTTRLTQRESPNWADPEVYEPLHELQVPLLQGASHVFAFSDKMRSSVIDDYGVDPSRVTTVYTGVNFTQVPSADPHRDYRPQRVLFVGNDYEPKGLPTLLAAFSRVHSKYPDAELHVVGRPGSFDFSAYPTQGVVWHGEISDGATLQGLFTACTVFAHPSRMEAFGHVLAEAMAFGLPCLGNNLGAVPEIISDEVTGYIANVDSVDDWTAKLDALFASSDTRRQLGQAGYAKARDLFDWGKVVDRMSSVIDSRL